MNKYIFFVVSLLILGALPSNIFAIGMMTQPIVIKDILRGQESVTTLTLLNSETKEVTYGLKSEGQITSWVTFYKIDDKNLQNPITEIKMPAKGFVSVKAKFTVPKDSPNGSYTGQVLAFLASSGDIKNDEASVSVSQEIGRKVTITVTDKETVQFKATFIPTTYDVQQGKPLKIRVSYDNQGNVAVRPDLQLKILKDGTTIYNAIFPYPEGEDAVRALDIKEIAPIEWQTSGQAKGNYKAELTVSLNGQEVQKENVSFSIGYFGFNFLGAMSFLGGNDASRAWLFIGTIFVVLLIALSILKKRGFNLEKARVIFSSFRKLF